MVLERGWMFFDVFDMFDFYWFLYWLLDSLLQSFWQIVILPHRPHGGRFAKPSGWQVRWVHLLEGLSKRCNCGPGLSFYTTSQVCFNVDFWNVGSRLRTWRISCCAAPRFEIPIMWLGWLCHLALKKLWDYVTMWLSYLGLPMLNSWWFNFYCRGDRPFYMFFLGFLDCSGRAGM